MPTQARRPDGPSLERRLPLLISGLLLLVVIVFGAVAYREVRRSALLAAAERMQRVAQQLAALSVAGTTQRVAGMRVVAANDSVRAAMRPGGRTDLARVVLGRTLSPADSLLEGWALCDDGGDCRLRVGAPIGPADSSALGALIRGAVAADSVHYGPFYAADGHVRTWTVVRIRDGLTRIGFLAQRRRLGDQPALEAQLRGLTGSDVSVYFTSADGTVWTGPRGRSLVPPFAIRSDSGLQAVTTKEGTRALATAASIARTPWRIVLASPSALVLQRPTSFLRRMVLVGLLLLAAGALGAWLVSRYVTRPLARTTEAADAIAGGDYGQRVVVRRGDELGRLAAAFNAMAQRIGQSRDETLRAVGRTERLQRVTAALSSALDLDAVAGVIVEQGLAAVNAQAGSIFVVSPDGATLELVRAQGYSQATLAGTARLPLAAPMPLSETARTGQPVWVTSRDEWRARYPDVIEPVPEAHAWAALPLVARGRVIGAMGLSFHSASPFDPPTRAFLVALAEQCAQALDRASLFDAAVAARREAEEAREAAQSASQAKSAFLAMMSHELRTPLNAIGGYTELMELGIRGPITDAQRHDLARIRRSQHHLLSIINDILSLSRIEAGQLSVQPTTVAVAEALRDVEALIAPQMAARGLRYGAVCDVPGLAVRADREKLQQILLNLLSNAARFTEPGGDVTLRCDATAGAVAFRVHDTGIGIPPEKLEAIFEPFVQVDGGLTRRTGGTGLGLAISRELAQAMHGRITVESELGRGSTFTLEMPRVELEQPFAERADDAVESRSGKR